MKQRVLTAVVMIPPVLLALTSTGLWPVLALAVFFTIFGGRELARLLKSPFVWPGIALGIAVPLLLMGAYPQSPWRAMALGACLMFGLSILSAHFMANAKERNLAPLGLFAASWVTGPFLALIALHIATVRADQGAFRVTTPLLLSFLPLWGGDTAAILAGKRFGRHPLWPALSPKKTWEGALANLVACVIVTVPLAMLMGFSPGVGAACGMAAGIFGQYGDLFESYVKRQGGFKDSGTMLPGHGGILDRIDSLLFTGPAIALILFLWPLSHM